MALDPKSFYQKLLPYARVVEKETGIPAAVTLTQWGHESGFEASNWIGGNNYAGIKNESGTGFKTYNNMESFTQDYIRVINLSYYDQVRQKAKAGRRITEIFEALGRSPWSEDSYVAEGKSAPGSMLEEIYFRDKVWEYGLLPDPTKQPGFWETYFKNVAQAGAGGAGSTTLPGGVNPETIKESISNSWWTDAAWWKRTGIMVLVAIIGLLLIAAAVFSMTPSGKILSNVIPKEG